MFEDLDVYGEALLDMVWEEWVPYLDSCPDFQPNGELKTGAGGFASRAADEAWCIYKEDHTRRRERQAKEVHGMVERLSRNKHNPIPPISFYSLHSIWQEEQFKKQDKRFKEMLERLKGLEDES